MIADGITALDRNDTIDTKDVAELVAKLKSEAKVI